jgi:pantothenate kinase
MRVTSFGDLCARARQLAATGGRRLLGITGPPGAGKSTLARAIVSEIGDDARLVEMDGFHLAQSKLAELGRQDRKGAIDTFDAAGFLALVRRLRYPDAETIYAPQFRREIDEPVAGALPINPAATLVVVEGNYLLVPERPWEKLRALLDEVWYCDPGEHRRLRNLVARHRRYGKSEDEARRWALGPDQRNAALIAATRPYAHLIVELDGQLPADAQP